MGRSSGTVCGVVLATGRDFEVVGILPFLHVTHKVLGVLGSEVGVFSRRLLTATPPWVPEDIDVWSPEGQARSVDVVEGTRFAGDGALGGQ